MRRAAVTASLLLVTGTLTATAQTTASATAPVRALVSPRPISVTSAGATDFGIVTGADILNLTGTARIEANAPGAGQSTAMFSVSGEPNTMVNVTCSGLTPLLHSTPGHNLLFEGTVVHSTDASNQAGAGPGCGGPALPLGFTTLLSPNGALHVWLGGWLHRDTDVPPIAGSYNGTYTLTVAY